MTYSTINRVKADGFMEYGKNGKMKGRLIFGSKIRK
jgi:hypothetical protein